jgi:hypothetical protein
MAHDDNLRQPRDALALLRALGSDAPAPQEAVRHVVDRLTATLSLNPDIFRLQDSAEPAAPVAAPRALEGATRQISSGTTSLSRPWMWTVGCAVSAAVAGGGVHAALWPEKVRVVYVDSRSEISAPATVSRPGMLQGEPGDPMSAEPTSTSKEPATASRAQRDPRDSASSARTGDSAWARERALLDTARRKLAQGEAQASLSELGRHGQLFPEGKLAEEREALMINALVSVEKYDEARQKAGTFRKRYPHSFLSPSVDAAILAIP